MSDKEGEAMRRPYECGRPSVGAGFKPAPTWSHRPGHAVVARPGVAVGLRGVAVDQGAAVERMGLAAHLVLDREQHLPRVEIDDVLEAIFVLVDLLSDEAERLETPIRGGELGDVGLSG